MGRKILLILIAFILITTGTAWCADSSVQQLIAARCAGCHATFGTREEILRVVTPGEPDKSRLYQVISGGVPRMPRTGEPLTAAEVASVRKWIEAGAPWVEQAKQWVEQAKWWALQPLPKQAPGRSLDPAGISSSVIDSFIQAKLKEKGLRPSPEADRRTLIRRVTYDLHGLPPSPEEVAAFLADPDARAYEKLVDRLLASPRYGERWGRHWLDTVHYGESHGYDKDKPRRNAWPYRDYVIQSFNEDKPYARFVREQLAGDVLFPDDPQATVALGFLAAGPWDFVGQAELREGTTDKNLTRVLDRDDMVTVTISAFNSMTVHCARCHDHKFDPIPTAEYYGLQAVFAGVDRAERPVDTAPATFRRRKTLLAKRRELDIALRPLTDAVAEVTTPQIQELDRQIADWKQVSATDPARRPAEINQKIAEATERRRAMVRAATPAATLNAIERLRGEIAAVNAEMNALPKPQMVYAAANYFEPTGTFRFAPEPRPVTVLVRGNVEAPGPPAVPGALSAMAGLNSRFEAQNEGERRAGLARWLTDPDNALTWRSIVNRVWHYHFGTGIVDSPNDFGHMGSLPTHPELLDWLAVQFRDSGGSFRKLHKAIVMTAAYRQSSQQEAANAKVDAENRYLWRANRQRLDAEQIRDSILAVNGRLDLTMGGPSVEQFWFKDDHSPVYDYTKYDPDAPGNYRRSVYRFLVRSVPDPLMERFDCPDVSMITAKRTTTITAIQALALMNNPFVLKQAEHLAERVRAEGGTVRTAFRLALQREPTAEEEKQLAGYLRREGLENLCRLVLNLNEFLFVD